MKKYVLILLCAMLFIAACGEVQDGKIGSTRPEGDYPITCQKDNECPTITCPDGSVENTHYCFGNVCKEYDFDVCQKKDFAEPSEE